MIKTRKLLTPKAIRQFRERLGFSQIEFAEKLFTTNVTISRWESGTHPPTGAAAKLLLKLMEEHK